MTTRSLVSRRSLGALLILLMTSAPLLASDLAQQGLEFDGVDDIVRVPHSASLDVTTGLTLEAWIQPFVGGGGIAGMWGSGGIPDKFLLYLENDVLMARIVRVGFPGSVTFAGPVVALNAWTHVAMTYDGGALAVFVNGELFARTPAAGSIPPQDLDLRMGIEDIAFPDPPAFFRGRIDHVRLWNHSRAATEMRRYFNQTVAPDASGLVGAWHLNENAVDQTVLDYSSAGNGGSLGADVLAGVDDPTRVHSDAYLRWEHLGNGLAGTNGVPSLAGEGLLFAALPVSLALEDARANSFTALFVGLNLLNAPFSGGILVPSPDQILLGFGTGPTGNLTLTGLWPGGFPPLFDIYFQWWIVDPLAVEGLAASNGLRAQTP